MHQQPVSVKRMAVECMECTASLHGKTVNTGKEASTVPVTNGSTGGSDDPGPFDCYLLSQQRITFKNALYLAAFTVYALAFSAPFLRLLVATFVATPPTSCLQNKQCPGLSTCTADHPDAVNHLLVCEVRPRVVAEHIWIEVAFFCSMARGAFFLLGKHAGTTLNHVTDAIVAVFLVYALVVVQVPLWTFATEIVVGILWGGALLALEALLDVVIGLQVWSICSVKSVDHDGTAFV
ncbi:hypothetical protein BC830DRAFT_911635 [Chytriomyces sp. MP71]|nr:hypothetical protein BC830DRAFT_911635 [Chytriomyces sp. MP71]